MRNVEVYLLVKRKCLTMDVCKYPNLWRMVQSMSVKYYQRSFD